MHIPTNFLLMIFRHLKTWLVVTLLVGSSTLAAAAEKSAAQPTTPPAAEPPDQPGYRVRPMPEDTFKPSEKVSEDYPITFPADI